MRGQIGNWSGQLCVGLSRELYDWASGAKLSATVPPSADRVILGTSPYGSRIKPDTTAKWKADYPFRGQLEHDEVWGKGIGLLPRFELHEVEFEATASGLIAFLPPLHELPVFKSGKRHAGCEDEARLLARDNAIRARSADLAKAA